MQYDVIIIGAGPGGIFAAYELLQHTNNLKIAVFEAGKPLHQRHCPIDGEKIKSCIGCKSCSIMSGFGGAGAFSDGKLSLSPDVGGMLPELIGYEYVLYSDTDSLFYISTPEIEKRIEAKNKELRSTAHYVELENGKKEYYNEFTEEPECLAFKGLHSKCYGVVTSKGLEITIAGVPARTIIGMEGDKPIYYTREEELSGPEKDPIKALDHLTDNFTFHINTGICALYIGALGYKTERKPEIIYIDGHEIHTAGGCVLNKLDTKTVVLDPNNKKKKYDKVDINPESMR